MQAMPEHTHEVMGLLVRTAEWLRSIGSTQWGALLEGEDTHNTADAVQRGDVYLFRDGETPAGVVMLLREPSAWDCELWGKEGHEGAVYLHRLAINRKYSGLGGSILRWAESGISFPGVDRIRLDCISDNRYLNSFYSGAGYENKGLAPTGFYKYEKRIK
nr:GNAT family N-acetyltransferase [Paenibacillus protaetiae]